jgi:HK97 family phage major capsid protein
MFGMMMRESFCRAMRTEVPERFRGEADILKQYREQRATLEESTGSGTYFVPTILFQQIIDTLEEISDIGNRVDLMTGMPTKGTIPTLTGRPTLQPKRASSDTQMTTSDPSFGEMSFDTEEAYILFYVDMWLLTLSPFALGGFLLPLTRDAYVEGMADWIMNADGTSNYNSTTGILNEATYVTAMDAGKVAFGDLDNAALNKVLAALLKRGRSGDFLMSLYMMGVLEDLNRTGKTPVLTYGQGGEPRCKGRPVVIDEAMPDEADNKPDSVVMAVGDLKSMLVVIAGDGINLATSEHFRFNRNQLAIRATGHLDIKRKPINTLRLLKTAAA